MSVTSQAHTIVDDPLAVVAATGLPGARGLSGGPLDDERFDRIFRRSSHHRLIGLLVEAIETQTVAATASQYEQACNAHRESLVGDLALERLLVETSAELHRHGLDHRALKGPAVAHLDYPDPAMRSWADIDLLVRGEQFDATVELLVERGGRRRFAEPAKGFVSTFGKGVCVTTGEGFELDLHRVFSSGPFGLAIEVSDLWNEGDRVCLGGQDIPVLSRPLRFLNACYHAALGGAATTRRSAVRDVAQLAFHPDLDFSEVLEIASRWRGRAVVAHALLLVPRRLAVDPEGDAFEWARSYRPSRFERTASNVHFEAGTGFARQAAAGLLAVRGVHARISYGRALLFPDRAYLAQRDKTYLRRLRRALRLSKRG